MSSRDGSGRSGASSRSSNQRHTSDHNAPRQPRASEPWDVDPADIDRYLSGRPTREQEARARQSSQGTAGQLDQLQRQRGQSSTQRSAYAGRQQFAEPEPADPYDGYATYNEPYVDQFDDDPYAEPSPPRARQSPTQRARQPIYHEDDELYADDPYLTYDDDDLPPPPQRRQRPRAQISKPNLPTMPKLTMPKAITNAELVNDVTALALIGIAVLSIAIMAIVVSNQITNMPETIPTHISAHGVGEALRGRNALWSIPILAAALSLMNIAASWFLARIDRFAVHFLLGASLLVQFIAWIAVIKYLW